MKFVGEKSERKNSISTGVQSQTHLNVFHTKIKQKQASLQKLVLVVQFKSQICLSCLSKPESDKKQNKIKQDLF